MFHSCRTQWLAAVLVGVSVVFASQLYAEVNLELRPATQTVTNGTGQLVEIGVYGVWDGANGSKLGRVQVVFTWDNSALELTGHADGSYEWLQSGFPDDPPPGGDGLNDPYTGLPANDGDAYYMCMSKWPPNVPPDATTEGFLIATLKFTTIDAAAGAEVAIEDYILSTYTYVVDAPMGGNDITGTIGAAVTVIIECHGNGECDDGKECTDDVCESLYVCSNTPWDEFTPCGSTNDDDCDDPDSCDAVGNCLPRYEPEDTHCGLEPTEECDAWDTCDGAGTCVVNYQPVDTPCGSSYDDDCDNPDSCDGAGTCEVNYEPEGTHCGLEPTEECDAWDTCDGAGTCEVHYQPEGTHCGLEPTEECDAWDTCDGAGTCEVKYEPYGTPCTEDENDCTDDVCDGGGACIHPNTAPGEPCGDQTGNNCTEPDTCNGSGSCVPNDIHECPLPGDPPEYVYCINEPEGYHCAQCMFGDSTPCVDDNECTSDWCSYDNFCMNSTVAMDGEPCTSNGVYCDGVEICEDGVCITPPEGPCIDGDCCTDDYCHEDIDECEFVCRDGSADCADDLYCNGVELCFDTGEDCVLLDGEDVDCEDSNICTIDECDEDADQCTHTPVPNPSPTQPPYPCDDGIPCTFDDYCLNGVCVPGEDPGSGDVDVLWIPDSPVVLKGDPVQLSIYAYSVDGTPDQIGAVSIVLGWDPTMLELSDLIEPSDVCEDHRDIECATNSDCPDYPEEECKGFWMMCWFPDDSQLDGLNEPFLPWPPYLPDNDGDAYLSALAPLGALIPVTQSGLHMVTMEFTALELAPGGTEVAIVDCTGSIPTTTHVAGVGGQLQGELGSATVTIAECFVAGQCNDGHACTIDSCDENYMCVHDPNDAYCTDGLYCNGIEICDPDQPGADPVTGCVVQPGSVPNCLDGTVCSYNDRCEERPGGYECMYDWYPDCMPCDEEDPGEWPDCDDVIGCTIDWCDYELGKCFATLDDDWCDDTLFCTGEEWCDPEDPAADPTTGCVQGDIPCPPEQCNEEDDVCQTCEPPLVEAVGGRYLAITAQHEADIQAAFLVTYCMDGTPISKYVGRVTPFDYNDDTIIDGTLGFLVSDPGQAVYRTPANWRGTVYVTGVHVIPETEYQVQAKCVGAPLTDPVDATYLDYQAQLQYGTWTWGDTAPPPDHNAGLDDLLAQLFSFQGVWEYRQVPTMIPYLDLGPASGSNCEPEQVIGVMDILLTLSAFQGAGYSDQGCPDPCAP